MIMARIWEGQSHGLKILIVFVSIYFVAGQRSGGNQVEDEDYPIDVDYTVEKGPQSRIAPTPVVYSVYSAVMYTTGVPMVEKRVEVLTLNEIEFWARQPLGYPNPSFAEEEGFKCDRPCSNDPEKKRTCRFEFVLDYYVTKSSHCGNCPSVLSDCSKPGCIPADGVNRAIQVVNAQMPGPSIRVCEGDRVIVNVVNKLREPTSIHWHGIHQRWTPWMDGVPGVTQCEIPMDSSFRYDFKVPIGGTYFWHSHSGVQRSDGVYGALIVRKPLEEEIHGPRQAKLYDHDLPEHEMIVMDWQEKWTREILLTGGVTCDARPKNILVNGKGRPHRDGTSNSYQSESYPVHEIRIEKDLAYRLRIISNGITSCPIVISIESHDLLVIATDGFDITPVRVNSLVVYPGERWDVVVRGNQPVDSYWIKFRGLNYCHGRNTRVFQVAVLNYKGVAVGTIPRKLIHNWGESGPPRRSRQLNPLNYGPKVNGNSVTVADLSNVEGRDDDREIISKEEADYKFYLSYDFNPVDGLINSYASPHVPGCVAKLNESRFAPQINQISHVPPKIPPLTQPETLQSLFFCRQSSDGTFYINPGASSRSGRKSGDDCTKNYCACTHLLKVKLYSIVEIILIDIGKPLNGNHPFHLHGHSFRVIGMERINETVSLRTIQRRDQRGELKRRRSNAPIKDTVTVPDGGYTIIRFRADNPGFWYFHCHVEFHVEVGMGLIFQVGETGQMEPPPQDFPKCGQSSNLINPPHEVTNPPITPPWRPLIFQNPIEMEGRINPAIFFNPFDKFYYQAVASGNEIFVLRSAQLTNWRDASKTLVYKTARVSQIMDPSIQQIDGKLYIYFHTDESGSGPQGLHVIENLVGNSNFVPDGQYGQVAKLNPQGGGNFLGRHAIIFQHNDGQLYMIWSARLSDSMARPYGIYITNMDSPKEVRGSAALIFRPGFDWHGGILDYPQILKLGSRTALLVMANELSSDSSCITMAVLEDPENDPLLPHSWRKVNNCLFGSNEDEGVHGVGPLSLTSSPDLRETWIVYKAKSGVKSGSKTIRAQRLNVTGNIVYFSPPIGLTTHLSIPSGQGSR